MKIRVLRGFWYPLGKQNMPVLTKDGQVDVKKCPVVDVPTAVAKELVAMQKAEFVDAEGSEGSGPMTSQSAKSLVA
jgi:hypothetical protein